jgi:uncharacterized protein (TIGR02246 family)
MSATRLRFFLTVAALSCLASVSEAQTPDVAAASSEAAAPATPEPEAELKSYLGQYLDAFNKGDAKAAAALWADDAVWHSDTAGSAITGRDAIEASLAEVFAAKPGLRLSTQIERTHVITDGVISLEGTTTTSGPGEEPSVSAFTAVVKKTDDDWRLCDVHEYATPVALVPGAKLQELAFLVGEWQDDSEGASVSTNVSTVVRWGAGESFLVRSYVISGDDGEPVLQGTQVIGWDPRAEKFRSWQFDSDGGFGEGVWSRAGDEWVGRLTETLADGSLASATQVIRLVDADTLEVATVGREVAGEPQPSSEPVRVKRVAAPEEVAGGE